MAQVTQSQRKAHTAIYNMIQRINNRDTGQQAVDNLLKETIWRMCVQLHLGDYNAARSMYCSSVRHCWDEEVI